MKKLRGIIIIIFCACLCVGYYYYLSNYGGKKEKELTEIEQLVNKDIDNTYPTTPREVIKLYNRMLLCIYNEKLEEKEFEVLVTQMREVFDEELLTSNPEEVHFVSLKEEKEEYKETKKQIISATISTSKEVEYKKVNGQECAYVESSYYIKGEDESERALQTYILRKDKNGRWKIMGYYRP